jgi:hypothetical protein
MAVLVAACGGGGDNVSSQDVQQAASAAVKKAQQQQKLKDLQGQVNDLKRGEPGQATGSPPSSSSSSSGGGTDCGDGVSVGPNTTCDFAQNVAQAYRESGSSVVRAYSPARGDTFAMSCSGTDPVVCRGGDNASVYIN